MIYGGVHIVEFWTTCVASRFLEITDTALRYHERLGHVRAFKLERGNGEFQRLFIREDIERFKRERDKLRVQKQARKPELVGTTSDAPAAP
jgi:hypothetical protein